jgi:uncharacterized protein (TIGR02466 family)
MPFDLWFPTPILSEKIENHKLINESLLIRISEIQKTTPTGGNNWIGKPYNTCGTFNIADDEVFSDIKKEVTAFVHLFASRLGVDVNRNKFRCTEGWLNVYRQNDFQEFHHHAGHQFSAVYYVKAPIDSSQIIFDSPLAPDMKPLPISLHSFITDTRAKYSVEEGQVIIFRSDLRHCVPSHQGTQERISLAFNFD